MNIYVPAITFGTNVSTRYALAVGTILFLFLARLINSQRKIAFNKLVNKKYNSLLFGNYSSKKELARFIFRIIGGCFLMAALVRPQWGEEEEKRNHASRDLLIALDISRSMLVEDSAPNRLACAQKTIEELVKVLPTERVGLLVFASSCVVQCPLTHDKKAFLAFLKALDSSIIAAGSTSLDSPLKKAVDLYASMPSKKNRILLLLTDGEDFSGNTEHLKQQLQSNGIHLLALGFGTEQGGPIPKLSPNGTKIGYETDSSGRVIMSRLNHEMLRLLAHDSGGIYVPFTSVTETVTRIVKRIEIYEKEFFDETTNHQRIERYSFFAAVSLFSFLLEWIL
jgi:Ca-activated chloride channel family protein